MFVQFNEPHYEFYPVYLETPEEIELVRKDQADELKDACPEDRKELESHLRIGGNWTYSLEELHNFVQKGVTLHGLPEWLIIK